MHPAYFPVFFWSLFIFASFLGYGETLRRALKRSEFEDLGWGLTAAWGMAVTLAIGGLLMAFKLAIAPILTAVIVLGAALATLYGVTHLMAGKFSLSSFRISLADLVLYLLAALAFASSIAWPHHIDPNDDLICYLMLPEKLLCTGTLIEPFSFQRAGTFGGQALLQALVMIVGAERNGHVPDMGFGHVICFGIFLKMLRQKDKIADSFSFLLLLLLLIIPVPRISTASSLTGAALLFALYETLRRIFDGKNINRLGSSSIPLALLIAGASTLRPMWMLAAVLFTGIYFLKEIWSRRKSSENCSSMVIASGTCAFLVLLLLLPWSWVLYSSNATFLNPPFAGNVNPSFIDMSTRVGLFSDFTLAIGFLATPETAAFMIALMLPFVVQASPVMRPISLSAALAVLLIATKCAVVIVSEVYRYTFPILLPAVLCVFSHRGIDGQTGKRSNASWVCLGLLLLVNFATGMSLLREKIVSLTLQVRQRESFFSDELRKSYERLQELVPKGEKIFVVVDAPYLLDFKRNAIDTVNSIGGAGPFPGLPYKQGPDRLKNYLQNHGYRFVIAVNFDEAVLLYTRKLWMDHKRPEWYWKEVWAPHALDFMDNIDILAGGDATVAAAGNARLIDLNLAP